MKKGFMYSVCSFIGFSLVLTGCSSQQNDDTDRPDDTNQTDKMIMKIQVISKMKNYPSPNELGY